MLSALRTMHLEIRQEAGIIQAETHFQGDVAPYWVCYILATQNYIYNRFASLVCRVRGHNWQDCGSYAGPESGREVFYCTRCSKSHTHTY